MAASAGRQITLNWGATSPATEIEGLREKGITLNGDPIDITSDDDNGWRSLLSLPAMSSVDISLSGVSKDAVLKTAWFSGDRTEAAEIIFPDGSKISGNFFIASFTETGTYNDATVFESSLQSTGAVVFTPGP